ncbi:MAG: TetR/AcrR family transcriptional regulator [Clostridia bacterium]|nr:TetR/AcrR family transcriptional regulator [Clostridia bacterium]
MAAKSGKKAEYRSALRSRRMIKTAFLELVHEKPVQKITVTDIVNRCGLNRGTFYSHYTGVAAVVEQIENDLIMAVEDVLESPENNKERTIHFYLTRFTELLKSDLEFYRLVVTCGGERFSVKFREFLLEKLHNGELVFYTDLSGKSLEVASQFMVGGFVSIYISWFEGKIDCTLDELCSIIDSILSAKTMTAPA